MSIALSVEPTRTRWLVDASGGPISEAFAERTKLGAELVDPSPWLGGWGPQARAAEGPSVHLPAPEVELLASAPRGALRHLRLRLRSQRGARVLSVEWPDSTQVSGVSFEGAPVTPWPTDHGRRVVFAGPSDDGVTLELSTGAAPIELLVADHTPGFPRGLNVPARPVTAAASQHGDVTVVSQARVVLSRDVGPARARRLSAPATTSLYSRLTASPPAFPLHHALDPDPHHLRCAAGFAHRADRRSLLGHHRAVPQRVGTACAGCQQIFGGEISALTELATDSRNEAMNRLEKHALDQGANCVLGMRFDSGELMQNTNEIVAYGTAVVLRQD